MKRLISIVSPVFREEDVLESFHGALTSELEKVSDRYSVEIIYVLDPSPDRSLEVLRQIAKADHRAKVLVLRDEPAIRCLWWLELTRRKEMP